MSEELLPCRETIASTIKPYLYIPMFLVDDEEYIKNRSLEIADEIIRAISIWNQKK